MLQGSSEPTTAEQPLASRYASSLFQASLDPLVATSLDGTITDVNEATTRGTGLARDALLGRDFSEFFTEPGKARSSAQRAVERGFITNVPLVLRHTSGNLTEVLYNASVYRDDQGAVAGVLIAARDVSELRERERHSESLLRLSRSLERSQTYAEALDAARHEVRTVIGYQNLWAYLLTEDRKYARAIVAGGPKASAVLGEDQVATLKIEGDRMLEEIARAEEIVIVADARTDPRVNQDIVAHLGNRTIVNVPVLSIERHLGSVGTGTFGDEGVRLPSASEQRYLVALASHMAVAFDRIDLSTKRAKAERSLRELTDDFVTLLENTGDFIYFKDQAGRFRFCSQTMAKITGHSSWRELLGKTDLEVFPEDTSRLYQEEELGILRDGKALLNKADPYYDERGERRWVSTNKWPVFAPDQKTVIGIFGISRDITDLKKAEDRVNELNRALEQRVAERTSQLEAANKELDAFSYSVSHDLRAPLRAIDGFSRKVLMTQADKVDAEGRRLLQVVRDSAKRMGQLIDDLLAFSRLSRRELALQPLDMDTLVKGVAAEVRAGDPARAIEWSLSPLPPAHGDAMVLRQVWLNLIGNAVKFTRNRPVAHIEVGGQVEGTEVVYWVRDDGAGFDMKYANKLFGVFQRLHTEDEFEGTGVGLAIAQRIVHRHQGRIWAEGAPGEGATFRFALPQKSLEDPMARGPAR